MATGTRGALAQRSETKVLMPTFSGKASDWDNFKFRFSAYLAKSKLLVATKDDFDPEETLDHTAKNNDLYYTLALCCEAPEFITLIMDAPDGDGKHAWGNIIQEYESDSPERKAALRTAIINATFNKFGGVPKKYFIYIERIRKQLAILQIDQSDDDMYSYLTKAIKEHASSSNNFEFLHLIDVAESTDNATYTDLKSLVLTNYRRNHYDMSDMPSNMALINVSIKHGGQYSTRITVQAGAKLPAKYSDTPKGQKYL